MSGKDTIVLYSGLCERVFMEYDFNAEVITGVVRLLNERTLNSEFREEGIRILGQPLKKLIYDFEAGFAIEHEIDEAAARCTVSLIAKCRTPILREINDLIREYIQTDARRN